MDLDQIRKDIDQIDQELVALLERRMVCVGQIVKYKEQQGIPVLDQGREREVLEKVGLLWRMSSIGRPFKPSFKI